MSWFDSNLDQAEIDSQNQRLNFNANLPEPGFFAGSLDALGSGLIRGGVEGINAGQSLLTQAAGADQAMSLGLSGMVLDGQGADEQRRRVEEETDQAAKEIGQRTAQAVQLLRPDPATTGMAGQILNEAGAILPRTVAAALVGGPVAGAVAAGAPAGYSGKQVAMAEGIDETTASLKGLIDAGTIGVGAVLPAAKFVKPLLGDLAIAVGANTGLGIASRAGTSALLEANGYTAQAAQYQAFDRTALATDVILGAAFFGIGRAALRRPTTQQVDAALTERLVQHELTDTAPGAPATPKAAITHQEALRLAVDQISRGEPVRLPESIHSAEFLRTAEEAPAVVPLRTEIEATALREELPAIRAELERQAAGAAPNVKDLRTELSGIQRTLDDLDATFKGRAKEFQGQGMSRKQAESQARQAIDAERAQLQSRQQEINGALDANHSAEQARDDLAAIDRGQLPDQFQQRVTERAAKIEQGFQRKPLAGQVAEGNRQFNLRQAAQQEITRLLDEIDRLEPRVEPVPLEIPARAVKAGEQQGGAPASAGSEGAPQPAKGGSGAAPEARQPGSGAAADPEIAVADEIMARVDDIQLPTGAIDADGNPVTVSARELLAESDAEIQAAQQESRGFAAAAACFLQRGEV
ncbi:hypothetical protein PHLH8_21000 [Pseudomonas sp. Pc102]|uniref:hypothetical protein n=1 Tax=Pseudomonas sp. Pc102 TaxID=2678261 RepID=UPI001BCFE3B4|nr:hypothetical protein [Pseudomonas sp. Pc102]BBP82458.1 hypothetical protein PHLH8_21000 [Pseudomonas sp. Pc102]